MNQNVLHHLTLIAESHGVYAEDLSDQLASKYTSLCLVVMVVIVGLKQYVFKPIQCWVPAEWPRPWEEYTENYCWIQNTYHVAYLEPGHPGLHARKEAEIGYFQWVPILLSLQAALVLVPHALWRALSAFSGGDPHRLVKLASEMEAAKSSKKRMRMTNYISSRLCKTVACAAQARTSGDRASCPGLRRQRGCFLFVAYVACKVAYLLCGLGHLHLMKAYLGFEALSFGWTCAVDLFHGRQWQQTRVFPRVTFCDVPVKHVGQWNTRSVQCVLPYNMLNEKIYIFLWFWIIFCMSLTVVYGLYWIASVGPRQQRLRYVRNLLRMRRQPARTEHAVESLADHLDGVFILQMVAARCGDVCAARIIEAMSDRLGGDQLEPEAHDDQYELATLPLRTLATSIDGNAFNHPVVLPTAWPMLDRSQTCDTNAKI